MNSMEAIDEGWIEVPGETPKVRNLEQEAESKILEEEIRTQFERRKQITENKNINEELIQQSVSETPISNIPKEEFALEDNTSNLPEEETTQFVAHSNELSIFDKDPLMIPHIGLYVIFGSLVAIAAHSFYIQYLPKLTC